ncbi:MAG: dipeptide ABC transporter ATP-binding protein [Myxococcales bacterium]|nr:dipeptide ABC transporter ATP-binding protein [Myxococcales bacterium]USN51605.1 MAG: dipeptide ABC transporter ATP-binding protein [Myxococcales bacterium]
MDKSVPQKPLLRVNNLKQYFEQHRGILKRTKSVVKAVDGVSFHIDTSETLGLVGESGCGKSTLGRSILRLLEPTSGSVHFEDEDVIAADKERLRALRRKMQIIFQDPFASLNPRMTVGNIIQEALQIHNLAKTKEDKKERVMELLSLVGLRKESMGRYPHEFSGGQRQRIGIARALAVDPKFVVCDEPISALDVSIQAQIINLLQDLQYNLGLTYLFIAHDLHVVRHIASRIAVMYLGNIVEIGDAKIVYDEPKHPYTQALLSAVPVPDPERKSKRILLNGEIPSPLNPPSGCKFHTRCPHVMPKCKIEAPKLITIGQRQEVACFLYE